MRVDNTNSTLLFNPASILLGSFIAVTLISGFILSSSTTKADTNDSVVDDISITVPTACTMGGNIATGQEHTATLQPGTYSGASGSDYENGIGTTTLTTFCNDFNGFSIYAIGYTGETDGDNTLVGTSTSGNATIPTKVYQSGDTTSNWSMKVNKITDSTVSYNPANMNIDNSFDSWHTVPDDYVRVAHYKSTTDGASSTTDSGTGALGAKVTTTYAAYISTTQPADTYTGKVKYVMVHPYMQDDSNKPSTSTETSFDNAFAAANKQKLNGYYKMQDMDSTICSAVTLEDNASETTLIDSRDNKTYTVSKFKDGNCWMTQNLDLDLDSTKTYTPQDTDIPANWTPSLSTYAANDDTWEFSYTTPESYDPGDVYWSGVLNDDIPSSTGDSHYHLGNYYNWTAAVAMNDSSSYETEDQNANQSICPAGWTLPSATKDPDTYESASDNDFNNLWGAYGFTKDNGSFIDANENGSYDTGEDALWTSPLSFAASGGYNGSLEVGNNGFFWSPVLDDADNARQGVFIVDGFVDPVRYAIRDYGRSVRCLAL